MGLPAPVVSLTKRCAPSAGMTCSLELSLPSPTGIWFKTPLSVGDTNTSTTQRGFRGRECGVANGLRAVEYPLNLRGASCLTLARWPLLMGEQGRRTGLPLNGLTSLPGPPPYTLLQAQTRAAISTVQREWNPLPEGVRRVVRMT